MSCRTKTLLPATNQLLQPKPTTQQSREQSLLNDRPSRICSTMVMLKTFSKRDVVRIKPFRPREKDWRKAVVIGQPNKRLYTFETSDSGVNCQNCVHLKRMKEQPPIWFNWMTSHITLPIQPLLSLLITPKHPLCQEWKNQPSNEASLM